MTGRGTLALEVSGLSKRFGGALALDGASLSVARGEVHGLLGSNGSGKSTLIKVLAGFHAPEPGAALSLYGRPCALPPPRGAGLAFVHQDLGLIPSLSVAENLSLGRIAADRGLRLDWRALRRRAEGAFARLSLDLDPDREVSGLSPTERALLAIARADADLLDAARPEAPGVLVLDEPTPFLPREGVERLFGLMRACAARGAGVIFVGHDIGEVRAVTDRATILRDGRVADTVETGRTPHDRLVELIVGRGVAAHVSAAPPAARPLVRVDGLSAPGLGPLSFEVARGEILGLAGLMGSGFEAVPAHLAGARRGASGGLVVGDDALELSRLTPRAALSRGVAYLPADRLGAAGVGSLPVADNVALPVLGRLRGRLGLTDAAVRAHGAALCGGAGVVPNAPGLPLSALSGGNAQKALMAKWLQTAPRLLLLDEPTQGVDVGARAGIWEALTRAASGGACVVLASTDAGQLASLCHRVLVLSGGQVSREIAGAGLTEEAVARACHAAPVAA